MTSYIMSDMLRAMRDATRDVDDTRYVTVTPNLARLMSHDDANTAGASALTVLTALCLLSGDAARA